jgi:hypothetical protein
LSDVGQPAPPSELRTALGQDILTAYWGGRLRNLDRHDDTLQDHGWYLNATFRGSRDEESRPPGSRQGPISCEEGSGTPLSRIGSS